MMRIDHRAAARFLRVFFLIAGFLVVGATIGGAGEPASGIVRGRVFSADTKAPVADARVTVRDSDVAARTDADGVFTLELPTGAHAVTITHPGFAEQTVEAVAVVAGQSTEIAVELSAPKYELGEFTLKEAREKGGVADVMKERRESAEVADVIGGEQIAKAGDSDAAGALKRATGLTIVGGRYVYVRGMGERYSATLLNGSTLPSPEPERRVVPLDIFPAGILESLVIQKSYSPDLPGEFGGGAVLLRTRGIPDRFVADVSASMGMAVGTTFQDGLTYSGGAWDWLGIDDGARALPEKVRKASEHHPLLERDRFSDRGYTADELEEFGEAMSDVWKVRTFTAPPNLGLTATVGGSVLGGRLGLLGSLNYGNAWDTTRKKHDYFIVGQGRKLELQHSYDFETTENVVDLDGIFHAAYQPTNDHRLESTSLLVRTTSNETRVYHGPNRDVGTDIRVSRLRWVEQTLFSEILTGRHVFPEALDFGIDWRYAYALASRHEPDTREYRYDLDEPTGGWLLSDRPEGNQRLFSDLQDNNHDAGIDLSMPFPIWAGLRATAKIGGGFVWRDRNVDTRRFKYLSKGPLSGDPDILDDPIEKIFRDANIGPDGFQFEEITRPTDNYTATQRVWAGFVMLDIPLWETLRLAGGVRVEQSTQVVSTFEPFNPDSEPVEADLETTDLLPAAALTWNFWRDMQFRFGYGKTVSRPDFRELSPATFNDVTGGRQVYGNPDLNRAVLQNVDFRWEWYFADDENLSLGGFYKQFTDPIETIVIPSAQFSISYANAKGATNWGAELEFRKNFGFAWAPLADLYVAGNVAWIESRVDLEGTSGIQTEKERALQGQSPYAVNVQLGYGNDDVGTSAALLYNVFGPRIEEVGALGAPDVVEEPVHQLDATFSQKLPHGLKVGLKAKNLLDLEIEKTQGDQTVETYFAGREFSLSLGWSYQ